MNGEFVGVWALRTIRDRDEGGTETEAPDFGKSPVGRIVYTASGHVSVQFMRGDRPPWSAESEPSDSDRVSATNGYGAYAGRYTVDEGKGVVRHHVEVALIPNRVGKDLERRFSFEDGGNRLILHPPPFARTGKKIERALTWDRIG
jgi:hypothetical protein